jgi:cell division ATPase FtsA
MADKAKAKQEQLKGQALPARELLAEPAKAKQESQRELVPQNNVVFALDIGTRTVVGIVGEQAETASGTSVFNMLDCVMEPHPKRAMIDGQIEDIRQVARIVGQVKEQLESRTGIKLEKVSIAAAGRALKTRRIVQEMDVSEMGAISYDVIRSLEIEAIQTAAGQIAEERGVVTPYYCVGFSVIGYTLDGHNLLSLESHKGTTASVELVATFLPNVVVEGLYAVMDICSLRVTSLTLEPIAAMNAIIPKEIRLINIALVDIGAGTSDIAISKDGSIVAYAMATIAGDEITEEIIKSYFVDFETAENIKQTCCRGEDCTYKDIFGMERTFPAADFDAKIKPSVDVLATTICENIITVNGGAPAAAFLIGGGSLVKGLQQAVSTRLDIPIERVALGSDSVLKNIDTGGKPMGAEFITPLGIAVTGAMNQGYDFSSITLNDKQIRVFDTNKITVFELLSLAGYKSAEILGRSGRSLTYTLNGQRKTVRGGGFEPAIINLGGKAVTLSEKVAGGDKVEFTPAVSGENATRLLRDVVPNVSDELAATVNGKEVGWSYAVQNLDVIETFVRGEDERAAQADLLEKLNDEISKSPLAPRTPPPTATRAIAVEVNGESVTLPANDDGSKHTLIELLNHIDSRIMDFENPPTPDADCVTTINGKTAAFGDTIRDGDKVVLSWA